MNRSGPGSAPSAVSPSAAAPRPVDGDRRRHRRRVAPALLVTATALAGCSLFSTPAPPTVVAPSLSPPGALGYVVCPNAVTPVELATHTAEPDIRLPISGTPDLGNFAIATSPNGRWAYVVTSDGVTPSPSTRRTLPPVTTGATADDRRHGRPDLRGERPERGHTHQPGHAAGRGAHQDPRSGRHPRHRGHAGREDRPGGQRQHHRPGRCRHPPGRCSARPRAGRHHLRIGARPGQHDALRARCRWGVPGRHGHRHRRRP